MKRSPIQPGRKALERGSTFERRGSALRRRTPKVVEVRRQDPLVDTMASNWSGIARAQLCAMCFVAGRFNPTDHVEGHHVLPLEDLKREGVNPLCWYDPRNLLTLCSEPAPRRCHDRHEQHVVRVPRDVVLRFAPEALAFAREVGLEWLFDREYPVQPQKEAV